MALTSYAGLRVNSCLVAARRGPTRTHAASPGAKRTRIVLALNRLNPKFSARLCPISCPTLSDFVMLTDGLRR